MLGPLPRLYRSFVVTAVLLVGIGAGAWGVHVSAVPLAATVGAALGAAVSVIVAFLLVHDFSHRPRPVRVQHHR